MSSSNMVKYNTINEKLYADGMRSLTNDLVAGAITEEEFIRKAKEKAVPLQILELNSTARTFLEAERNGHISPEYSRDKINEEVAKCKALTTA